MVGGAHLILTGKIIDVKKDRFIFEIDEVLIGNHDEKTIEVMKQSLDCPGRWMDYKVDQTLMLFLNHDKNRKTPPFIWRTWSEWPIVDKYAYGNIFSNKLLKSQWYEIFGAPFLGLQFKMGDLTDAIKNYRKCFFFKAPQVIEQICDEAFLERFAQSSTIHKLFSYPNG